MGCPGCCRKLTELKLDKWLRQRYPTADLSPQHPGPVWVKRTHFDFHLAFPDGFAVIVELDGPQHFWHGMWYSDDGCARDVAKEKWAVAQGMSVVRVLQVDVWEDRLGWDGYIVASVEAARSSAARIFVQDAPEYNSDKSGYVTAHVTQYR